MYVYVDGCDGDYAMRFLHMVWERGSHSLDIYIYLFCVYTVSTSDGVVDFVGPPFFQSSVFTGSSLLLNMWGPLFPAVLSYGFILLFNRFGVLAFWPSPKKE